MVFWKMIQLAFGWRLSGWGRLDLAGQVPAGEWVFIKIRIYFITDESISGKSFVREISTFRIIRLAVFTILDDCNSFSNLIYFACFVS